MAKRKATPVVMSSKNENVIHVEVHTVMPRYNSFACGYGKFEDKSKKRCSRKAETRKMIKEYV